MKITGVRTGDVGVSNEILLVQHYEVIALDTIAKVLSINPDAVILIKSTLPVG